METETEREHQSWRIRVTAKAKYFNFRFRFKAATHSSTQTLSFFRFSILLNLPHFLFTISSRPQKQPRSSFNKFLRKFRPRIKPNNAAKTDTSSNLSLQMQLHKGFRIGREYCVRLVTIVASVVCFVTSFLLNKFKIAKVMNFPAFFIVGTVTVYYLFLYFYYYNSYYNYSYNYWKFMGRFFWNRMSNLK